MYIKEAGWRRQTQSLNTSCLNQSHTVLANNTPHPHSRFSRPVLLFYWQAGKTLFEMGSLLPLSCVQDERWEDLAINQ